MEVLKETNLTFLGERKKGKVRDIYLQKDRVILVSTDRHSSFDRIIAHIPHKGQVLNQVSAWWFDKTKDIISNHCEAIPDPNVTVAKKYKTVPVEAVVRGYLTGVTDTAIWTRYSSGQRDFGGVTLPDGMKKKVDFRSFSTSGYFANGYQKSGRIPAWTKGRDRRARRFFRYRSAVVFLSNPFRYFGIRER